MYSNTKSNKISPVFARHETFHPRFGWLKKGYDAAIDNSNIFLEEDAAVILGVGKNMVRSIRYWCSAFGILNDISRKGGGKESVPTDFGNRLLANDGWDPYLESNSSLWLLHWQLVQPNNIATAWYYTFNKFHLPEFVESQLVQSLNDYVKKEHPSTVISPASIKKDVNCLFRMYAKGIRNKNKIVTEETLDCPFSDLGIIERLVDSPYYVFNVGYKEGLEPEVIVAICLDYVSKKNEGANTISISNLLYDSDGPGLALKLTEEEIYKSIEIISGKVKEIAISDSAGIIQLSFMGNPETISLGLLNSYFNKSL